MDNDDAKHTLLTVRRMVEKGYPYPPGSDLDPRYAMAFGLITGIVIEAIQAVQQDRKASFTVKAEL